MASVSWPRSSDRGSIGRVVLAAKPPSHDGGHDGVSIVASIVRSGGIGRVVLGEHWASRGLDRQIGEHWLSRIGSQTPVSRRRPRYCAG